MPEARNPSFAVPYIGFPYAAPAWIGFQKALHLSRQEVLTVSAKQCPGADGGQDVPVGAAAASAIDTGRTAVRLTRRLSARFVIPGLHPHFGAGAVKSTSSSTTAETPTASDAVPSEFPRCRERALAARVGGSFGADILNARVDLRA